MRSPTHLWLPVLLSSALVSPSPAAADPIEITSGVLVMGDGSAPFDLVGDDGGFRLFGSGFQGGFPPHAFVDCGAACDPGVVAQFQHATSDFHPTAIRNGTTYNDVNVIGSTVFAELGFSGSVILPPLASTAVLQAPFTMEGVFSVLGDVAALRGSGVMTSTWASAGDTWSLSSVRYDFSPAPVPEPATFLLTALGGAAVAVRRRKAYKR